MSTDPLGTEAPITAVGAADVLQLVPVNQLPPLGPIHVAVTANAGVAMPAIMPPNRTRRTSEGAAAAPVAEEPLFRLALPREALSGARNSSSWQKCSKYDSKQRWDKYRRRIDEECVNGGGDARSPF
jgi:hypothetical protein